MKLAFCYTIYDGLELLEKSIENIYPVVDEIVICWQRKSHKGKENPLIWDYIQRFTNDSKLHLVEFAPMSSSPKINEMKKHQLMIDAAREIGCTHFIMGACDHFYKREEVNYAKEIVAKEDYDVTFTAMFTYFKKPTWQVYPKENYFMPFICKITRQTKIKNGKYPIYVDPSVQVYPCNKWLVFSDEEVILHHYSYIRNDINEKLDNGAYHESFREIIEDLKESYNRYELGEDLVHLPNHITIEAADYFGIYSHNE